MMDSKVHNEEKKLDWMYKDSSQIVDREEYLLGRKIDKQFENNVLPPEKDCLPTSIFIGTSVESQVDIARKLQDDPLYLIKKKEIESREQLLKNPRKLKQLQEMIARQRAVAEKQKKKQMKKRKRKDLDAILVKKCKKLFGDVKKLAELKSSSEESDNDVNNKRGKEKVDANLDKMLADKYKQLSGSVNLKQLTDLTSSSESEKEKVKNKSIKVRKKKGKYNSSEDEAFIKKFKNKKRSDAEKPRKDRKYVKHSRHRSSSSESNSSTSNRKSSKYYKNQHKDEKKRKIDPLEQNKSVNRHHERNKSTFKEKSKESNCVRSTYIDKNSADVQRMSKKDRRRREVTISNERKQYESRHSSSSDSSPHYKSSKGEKKARSSSESEDDNPTKISKYIKTKASKKIKKESEVSSESEPSDPSTEASSCEEKSQPGKKYGLVLPANYVPKKVVNEETKIVLENKSENKSEKKGIKRKLTDEEKEQKLKEMMSNAKWRDELRDKNIKAYSEKLKTEKDNYVYNEDFMRNQMANAISQGTVESRVKANINTIQRSKASMNENFARRK